MSFRRTSIFSWLAAALALAPAALFAYLGQFSRPMFDDYCQIALGKELGAWGYMARQLNTWSGSYANWLFKGVTAPLDTLPPMIMPMLIVALWLVGLAWLVFQVLTYLKIDSSRRLISVAAAALAVAAAIDAFYSPQSFYWYSANTQNALPLALLTIYMALALWLVQRRGRLWGIIAGAALCFTAAGSSEIFAAFQAAFFTFCLLALFALLPSPRRCPYALVFGAGWLATLVGLAIQLNAPGTALRAERIAQTIRQPDRSISVLIYETATQSFAYINHPQAIAGFVMLMAVGLLVMLVKYKPHSASKAAQPIKFALPPLWLGLIFQLLWMPLLWLQISDSPQWLGRFSSRYMVVVVLNVLFVLGFMVLLWQRKRAYAQLQRRERGLIIGYIIAALSIFGLLFLWSQISIGADRRSAAYLLASLLMLLIILTWRLLCLLPSAAARRFGWLALCSSGIGWACIAVMVFVSMYGAGYVQPRTMAAGAYLLVAPGLLWGVWIGALLKHDSLSSRSGQTGVRLLKLGCLAVVLVVAVGIALGQAALLPKFQLYAREWDARHQEIMTLRDSGRKNIEVKPLTWNLADYAAITTVTDLTDCAPRYYEVKSIAVMDD